MSSVGRKRARDTAPPRLPADDDLDGNVFLESAASAALAAPPPASAVSAAPPPKPAKALYKRDDGSALSAASAAEQAAAVWSAFAATKVGARLTDAEVAAPLNASNFATAAAPAAATAELAAAEFADLPARLRALLGADWRQCLVWGGPKSAPVPPASPTVIIVSLSAARAAQMLKPLAVFHGRVAKLFGKHFTVDAAAASLRGAPVALAVGTPHRLSALLAAGALSLARARLVVLDARRDVKGFTLIDHPNLRDDFATLLRDHLHARLVAPGGALRLAIY
jgi:hypothetical protein